MTATESNVLTPKIAVPDRATLPEELAAEELRRYLERVANVRKPVVSDENTVKDGDAVFWTEEQIRHFVDSRPAVIDA